MNFIFILLILFALQLLYFRIANHYNIIDKPNERSSHSQITLLGGGVIFYFGVILYFVIEGFNYPWFLLGLTLISAISFADDIRPQSSFFRLLIHLLSMILMFYGSGLYSLPWFYTLIAFILSVGIINAYNFMDGINGITGAYSLVVTASLWYVNSFIISFIDSNLLYIVLLSIVVFNFFNFRKVAKCFAGDVGAISMAFIIVFFIGLLITKTNDFSYLILLIVYGVETILTIIHRIILKENIFEAHRKHAFQLMANELKIPHLKVATFYALLQAIIFIGFILFKNYDYLYLIITTILLSVFYIVFKLKYYKLHISN